MELWFTLRRQLFVKDGLPSSSTLPSCSGSFANNAKKFIIIMSKIVLDFKLSSVPFLVFDFVSIYSCECASVYACVCEREREKCDSEGHLSCETSF